MAINKSFLSNIKTYLQSLTLETRLFIFAVVLMLCTALAIKIIFSTSQTALQASTYTLTKSDFGKIISVKNGDTITLNLPLSNGQTSALASYPPGIVRQISNTNNNFRLQAVKPGTTVITVTSRPNCKPGTMCPAIVILDFKATIIVY